MESFELLKSATLTLMLPSLLQNLTAELNRLAKNPENTKDYSRFHKDKKPRVEIITPLVQKLSAQYFLRITPKDRQTILAACDTLLQTNTLSHQQIAFDWAFRIRKTYAKEDFYIFEQWLKKYVTDWSGCDDLCTHAFGNFIYQFPEYLPEIKTWTKSPNTWLRRAATVVLIYSLRKGKYLKELFSITEIVLEDKEDLVQKGYGWTLKEASKLYQKEIFAFVMKHRATMPRTAFRYAIEKLPTVLRKKAMEQKQHN